MEFFPDQALVRLRNRTHGTYLHANRDGVGITLQVHRESLNTAWHVHRVLRGDRDYVLLHSAAYGRYLALSPETSQVYTGRQANLTVQGVYEAPEQDDVLWVPARVDERGDNVDVLVRHAASNRLLRASPWNNPYYIQAFVDSDNAAGTTMHWVVEAIPLRPEPPVIPLLVDGYFDPLFRIRTIVYMRADDQGNFDPLQWKMLQFGGQSVLLLRRELAAALGEANVLGITLCAWAGSNGRLTPLVIDLPSDVNTTCMCIVVLTTGSPAALALRHPDIDA